MKQDYIPTPTSQIDLFFVFLDFVWTEVYKEQRPILNFPLVRKSEVI
jgi:hypothetical protein